MKLFSVKIVCCLLFGLVFIRCKTDTLILPIVSGNNVSQNRGVTDSQFEFIVTLDKASTSEVSFDYSTQAGSAQATTDFVSSSGTITIPAGSKSGSIMIEVTGDSARKANQIFLVVLSNPKNCVLPKNPLIGTIVNDDGSYYPVDNAGYTTPNQYIGYTLAWSDEFTGKTINASNWSFESGNNNGWGNQELEYYTGRSQNAFVSQGNLIIEARTEAFSGSSYTSARMKTEGNKSFQYGRVDIRAKLPQGQGIWPALWMLGDDITTVGWPACGEIDIMELLGQTPNKVYGTLHWGSSGANQSYGTSDMLNTGTYADSFHVYSMTWTQSSIELLIDDVSYFTMNTSSGDFPFNSNFFFIFNIAVGGNWPGSPDATTTFPQRMVVDYVRVFQ
jgi:hypothetical protein